MNCHSTVILLKLLLLPAVLNAGGLVFLKLETSARSAAMGGTGTALSGEPSIVHYNPAGIAELPSSEIQLMYTSWIEGMSLQYGGAVLSLGRAAIGVSLLNSAIEGIEVRTRPGPPESEFTARNFSAGASFAYRVSPSFRVGVSSKVLYEKIYVDEATGYAFDVGVIYHSPTPGLRFGFSVLNLGSMSHLRNEPTELPLTYRVGSSYELPFIMQDISVRLAVDALQYSGDDKLHLRFGGEFGYARILFGRIGLQTGIQTRSFTAGLGIKHGSFKLDYAYTPLSDNLGSGHTLGVGVQF